MLKRLSLIALSLLLACAVSAQKKSDEEAAIKQAIEDETHYFNQKDYKSWATTWMHKPYVYWSYVGPNEYGERKGWEELSAGILADMEKYPDPTPDFQKKIDYEYVITDQMAFVTFLEDGNWSTRVLEKKGGKWKLIRMGVVQTAAFHDLKVHQMLNAYSGDWHVDPSSVIIENEDDRTLANVFTTARKTAGGLEMESVHVWKDIAGEVSKVSEKLTLAYNTETNQTAIFQITAGTGWSKVATGECIVSESGNLYATVEEVGSQAAVKLKYDWVNANAFKVYYRFFTKDGEQSWAMSYIVNKSNP